MGKHAEHFLTLTLDPQDGRMKPVKGMSDLLPSISRLHDRVIDAGSKISKLHGFQRISTPVLEYSPVFERSLGDGTDILTKELYKFPDKNNQMLTLRPEGTAGVVRSFITNGLHKSLPQKLYYHGPMFRYENPQKGRSRQFEQFGVEVFGLGDPTADAELLSMASDFLKELGLLEECKLEVNTLGDAESRLKYRKALTEFFTQNSSELSETSRHRLERGHVFRILDSKETADERLISERACPVIDDYLTGDSRERFETTLEYLHSLGVAFNRNPRLVRGLDYYSHTVFEFIHNSSSLLGPSQSTVLAGGRYDGLVESLQDHRSNAVTPALGWAAGINRLAMLLANRNGQSDSSLPEVLIVFIPTTNTPQQDNTLLLNCGLVTAQKLRSCGVNAQYAGDLINNSKLPSSSKQLARLLKRSNRPQAAIFIGWEEVSNGNLTVKNLATGKQLTLPAKEAIEHIKGLLY